jgi:hypothetical protein
MKNIYMLFMVTGFLSASVYARGLATDTTAIVAAARHDAENFSFDKVNKKAVINNLRNPTSDYFKPSEKISGTSLLNDSLYVKIFKVYAIKHVKAKRATKTLLIVGGSVLVFLGIIIAALAASGPGLNE